MSEVLRSKLVELYENKGPTVASGKPSSEIKVGYGDDWDEIAEAERLTAGRTAKAEQIKKRDAQTAVLFGKLVVAVESGSKAETAKLLADSKFTKLLTTALMEVGDLTVEHTETLAAVSGALGLLQVAADELPKELFSKVFVDGLRVLKKKIEFVKEEASAKAAKAESDRLVGIISNIELKASKYAEVLEGKYSEVKSAVALEEKSSDVIALAKKFLDERKVQYVDLSTRASFFDSDYTASASEVVDKKRMARIKRELTILEDALPDGIHVFVNEDRFDKIIVHISGPEGTPYEYGSFLFDMYLPAKFPAVPPMMNLINNGNFRFNPNLYTSGYVCFSLLGTWDGPGWNPAESTLLQLLVSLQAMVLCEFPYCNEPGWEDAQDSHVAINYHSKVRLAKYVFGISRLLSGDLAIPSAVKSVVTAHAILHKDSILRSLESFCIKDYVCKDCYARQTKVPMTLEEVKAKLAEQLSTLKLEDS